MRGYKRSYYKLETLYLYYDIVCGHLTCQGDDILQGASTHKFAWIFNEFGLMRSRDKLNALNVHLQQTIWDQTMQGIDFP